MQGRGYTMKTIIAGSRGITDYQLVAAAVDESGFDVTVVVSGGAKGVDGLGERWALEHGVPIVRVLPDWRRYGRGAGLVRNAEMVDGAEALVALWDGKSRGTANVVAVASRKGLRVFVKCVAAAR